MAAAPDLVDNYGVGTDTAGQLLVTAGDNRPTTHTSHRLDAYRSICSRAGLEAAQIARRARVVD